MPNSTCRLAMANAAVVAIRASGGRAARTAGLNV